jgi:hypothetical protein
MQQRRVISVRFAAVGACGLVLAYIFVACGTVDLLAAQAIGQECSKACANDCTSTHCSVANDTAAACSAEKHHDYCDQCECGFGRVLTGRAAEKQRLVIGGGTGAGILPGEERLLFFTLTTATGYTTPAISVGASTREIATAIMSTPVSPFATLYNLVGNISIASSTEGGSDANTETRIVDVTFENQHHPMGRMFANCSSASSASSASISSAAASNAPPSVCAVTVSEIERGRPHTIVELAPMPASLHRTESLALVELLVALLWACSSIVFLRYSSAPGQHKFLREYWRTSLFRATGLVPSVLFATGAEDESSHAFSSMQATPYGTVDASSQYASAPPFAVQEFELGSRAHGGRTDPRQLVAAVLPSAPQMGT